MKILAYTFYSAPFKEQLQDLFGDLFVLKKLTHDLPKLLSQVLEQKPDYLIGVAKFGYRSQYESVAINQFHKNKKVSKTGPFKYKLFIPKSKNSVIKVAQRPSDSFCNWTMYKISHLIQEEKLKTKLIFVHLNSKQLTLIKELLQLLRKNENTKSNKN
ncbi:hypothetical protein JW766_04070 [Candidatus Dojkabacteria bacterium]|nr:hypothetical protein [Candidatus Dojkabacteria bacterium]